MCAKFEKSIIENASSTLAGIKVASMYNFRFSNMQECEMILNSINKRLNVKGVYVEVIKNKGDFYLIYVYRKSKLIELVNEKNIAEFLREYGYDVNDNGQDDNTEKILVNLKCRVNEGSSFPHEIGVLLGYPLNDVKAFIENEGLNCIMCGIWKVYYDEQNAMKTFCKLKRCKDVYIEKYNLGSSMYDMVVSA